MYVTVYIKTRHLLVKLIMRYGTQKLASAKIDQFVFFIWLDSIYNDPRILPVTLKAAKTLRTSCYGTLTAPLSIGHTRNMESIYGKIFRVYTD